MPITTYEIIEYAYVCESQVNDESDTDVLYNCEGSEVFREKEDAEKQGWREDSDGKVWCKFCFHQHNSVKV